LAAYSQAQEGVGPQGVQSPKEKSVHGEGSAVANPDPAAADFCECVRKGDAAANKRIERALAAPLHSQGLDFTDQPLHDVLMALQDEYGIPVQLNRPALEAIGLAPDTPINVNLHNISLRSALNLMLRQVDLTYVIQDEVLMVTTKEDSEKYLVTCVYNVQGLVDDSDKQSMEALIDSIEACVATETWTDNGKGSADIMPLRPGLLVVSQTSAVQEEVSGLLGRIRKLREKVPVTKVKPRAPEPARVTPAPTPAEPAKKPLSQPAPEPGPAADDPFGA
jgi:hypothetical protein